MTGISRRVRIIADIIQTVANGKTNRDEVVTALSVGGMLNPSDLQALATAAVEFGFLTENGQTLGVSNHGSAFERYVSALSEEEGFVESTNAPREALDRPTLMELCATFPPPWVTVMASQLGDRVRMTRDGYKKVVSDARTKLCLVTPFVDIAVLQMCLESKHSIGLDFFMITSEQDLTKEWPSGRNFNMEKLRNILAGRFRSGSVFYLRHAQTIAHAKIWCSERAVFVTSANVTSDSITENFELGIYTDEEETVATVWEVLEQAFKMSDLTCILKSS